MKTIQIKDKVIKEKVTNLKFFNLMDKVTFWFFFGDIVVFFGLVFLGLEVLGFMVKSDIGSMNK
jgi:hypothetical protein